MSTVITPAGEIRNVGHVAVIHSKAGSVRSNHLHRTGWHYLYVVSGLMVYRSRRPGERSFDKQVGPGEMVYTGPGIEHRTEFREDTVMVSLASENQGPEHHDEDLVRVDW